MVYFPRGRYFITDTLDISNGNRIILRGEGLAGAGAASTLRMNDATKNMIDTTGLSDVLAVEHMCFWGAGARTGDAGNLAVGNAFYIPRMTDGRFRNNWFINIPKAGVYSPSTGPDANMGLNNTHFIDNTFDISGTGIRIDRAHNDIILGNRFYSLAIGVDLKWGERVQINSNHFDLVGRLADGSEAAIRINGGEASYRSLQISSNVFSENGNDIKLDAGTGSIVQTTIVGNNSKFTERSFLILNGTNDTQVLANHVRESSYLATNTYSAFVVTGSATATRISENTAASDQVAAKYGLEVDATAQGTILGFNRFAGATGAVKVGNVLATQNPFGEPSTVVSETGYAGFRFWADQASRSGASNVNFRTK
ncbi:MAG TPA: hypothetical protein VE010_00225, partial [Thermoanaerobaculia bacterium]|nr:hypothetical protein [Thermoanaerobaculia bacterium]